MNTIIRAMVVCTALASGAAFADGVPLITSGPALTLTPGQAEQAKAKGFVKHHFIVLNKNAFLSNVVIVTIDGKDYRFVGSMSPQPAKLSASQVQSGQKQSDLRNWGGSTGSRDAGTYGAMSVSIDSKGSMFGIIDLQPSRRFTFSGNGVMTEVDVNKIASAGVREVDTPSISASGVPK